MDDRKAFDDDAFGAGAGEPRAGSEPSETPAGVAPVADAGPVPDEAAPGAVVPPDAVEFDAADDPISAVADFVDDLVESDLSAEAAPDVGDVDLPLE